MSFSLAVPMLVVALFGSPMRDVAQNAGTSPAPDSATTLGMVRGVVVSPTHTPRPDAIVRLRDARSHRVVAVSKSGKDGRFSFQRIEPGRYVAEVVDDADRVLAASSLLSVAPGKAVIASMKMKGPS